MAITIEKCDSGALRITVENPTDQKLKTLLVENFAKVAGMVRDNKGADGLPLGNPVKICEPGDPGFEWVNMMPPGRTWASEEPKAE